MDAAGRAGVFEPGRLAGAGAGALVAAFGAALQPIGGISAGAGAAIGAGSVPRCLDPHAPDSHTGRSDTRGAAGQSGGRHPGQSKAVRPDPGAQPVPDRRRDDLGRHDGGGKRGGAQGRGRSRLCSFAGAGGEKRLGSGGLFRECAYETC